jgi:hypothetical protein
MAANTDLGELLLILNPYMNALLQDTNLMVTGIDIYCRNPTPAAAAPVAPSPQVAEISYELDGPYSQDWNFRNQPQKIGMAVRICIRYQITNNATGYSSWAEDYLLVGYGGGMGG